MSVIVLLTVAIAVAENEGFRLERAGTPLFWVLAIGPTLVIALGAVARGWTRGGLGARLRPVWGDFTRGVLAAAALFAVSYAVARSLAGTPRESWLARIYLQLGDPAVLRAHLPLVGLAIVLATFAEEIVWRALVPRILEARVGARWAYPAAAIPYALAHAPTIWALRDPEAGLNPVLPLAALGLGLALGELTRRFDGRIVPAVIAHAGFDWAVVIGFRLWGPSV